MFPAFGFGIMIPNVVMTLQENITTDQLLKERKGLIGLSKGEIWGGGQAEEYAGRF